MLLAVPAALIGSFGVFGTALWTNIYVDGDSTATTVETMLGVAWPAVLFFAPPVVVVALAHVARASTAQHAFGIAATLTLALFTWGYGLVPIAAIGVPWGTALSIRRGRVELPPLDLIAVVSYFVMFWFFAYAEAHR